jgi:HlyD family secretion protein
VATARARLAQAQITAPSAGRVLTREVEPGQIVQPGRALLTLALDSPVELVGQVDERYLEQLQAGQGATVRADAFAQAPFPATVRLISPLVDAQRGSVEIKLVPQGAAPAFLREDMTLSVEVNTGRREQALVVPVSALEGSRVRVLQDGKVQAREVRLGLVTLDAAEVTQGLAAGDVVLLDPAAEPGSRARADTAAGGKRRAGSGVSQDSAGGAMSQAVGR